MAADKKTYLRNAQKQVQKGQLDRAVTSYKAILKMDPNDVKVHNTLGDIYIRRAQKQEGIKEYLWVAEYYEKDGFFLRSIAICQKILNLDSDLVDVRLRLADLYTLQKLPAESKKQYLLVADHYDKKGKVTEALEVFGKIADLDPSNLGVRVKLGRMYEKQSLPSKAAEEYTRAAQGHIKAAEFEKASELLSKALELAPESVAARRCLADYHTGREEWSEVVKDLAPLASGEEADTGILKTYAAACLKSDMAAEAIEALEKAREVEPSSMPLKTLLGRAYGSGGRFEDAFELLNPSISDYLKDGKVDAAEDLARQLVEADSENDKAQQRLLDVIQQKGDEEEMLVIYRKLGDIYQAKGLPRNAVGVLEKYLELKPGDDEVAASLESLRGGVTAVPAPAAPQPAALPGPEAEEEVDVEEEMDLEMLDLDGESLADLGIGEDVEMELDIDADMVVELAAAGEEETPPASVETGDAQVDEVSLDDEEEEIFIEPAEIEAALEEAAALAVEAAEEAAEEVPDVEEVPVVEEAPVVGEIPDVEEVPIVEEAALAVEAAAIEEVPLVEEAPAVEETFAIEDDLLLEEEEPQAPPPSAVEAPVREEEPVPEEEPLSREMPDLDEVSFAGLADDETTAGEPVVEEAPVAAEAPDAVQAAAPVEEADLEAGPFGEEEAPSPADEEMPGYEGAQVAVPEEGHDLDVDALHEAVRAEAAEEEGAPAAAHSEEMEEFLAEADFYFQQGLFDEAEFLYRKLTKLDPDNSDIAARIARLEAEKLETAPAPASPAPGEKAGPPGGQDEISALESDLDRVFADDSAPAAPGLKITVSGDSETKEGEFSDFLSELRQELDTDEIPTPVPVASDEESLSEIFQEFQAGIKEQLGEEDFETHYNLGIAYKEMGLMEEALGEFVLSEKSVARRLDSISMISLCYKDMGREEEAVAKLEEGLDLAGEGSDEQKGLLYDLVELYQKVGRTAEAAEALERLKGIDPSYRDVSSRTGGTAPKAPAAPPPAPSEGGQDPPKQKKNPKVSYL